MLRARTTDGPEGATLEGDRAGMEEVHALVMRGAGRLGLDVSGDPSPYGRFLRWLVVEETAAATVDVVQEVGGAELIVRCPPPLRDVVASNLTLLDAPPGYHSHYEYHPDHHHLSADAVPIVVERL